MRMRESITEDYPALVGFYNAITPDTPTTEDALIKADEKRDPRFGFKRWLAIEDECVVAVGMHFQREWFYHPRKFRVSVLVKSEHRRQGIGAAIYDQVMAGLMTLDPLTLIADT